MCLGIPAKVERITDRDRFRAEVSLETVKRDVDISSVCDLQNPDAMIGQWVLVHVGFALAIIDENEALKTLALLHEIADIEEELQGA